MNRPSPTAPYVIREAHGNRVMADRQWAWLIDLATRTHNPTPPAPVEARQERPAQKTG
ncbi:hypothetical protein [Deinococcus humi]|uniref:Uncharacterized protein n=1 Tax=Deinococcus humi TaxID=662880 RepID=A0A7W8JUY4_9DEIO|nr:hypothetical protein [Deinococcus humi]MBB5362109.1 hypothetical protein [Deinococcus humi]GGO22028.1 hypothetical protein GCM10008949_08880 [Deinococcus humi]